MAVVLIHETAHTLGLEEYYDIANHAEEGYQCVMENYDEDNKSDLCDFYDRICSGSASAFCGHCKQKLEDLISD